VRAAPHEAVVTAVFASVQRFASTVDHEWPSARFVGSIIELTPSAFDANVAA